MFHSLRRKSVLESGNIRFGGTTRHSLYLRVQDYAPAPPRLVVETTPGVARQHRLGHLGSLRRVPADLRGGAAQL